MKRWWCRLMHNALMQPVHGRAICRVCLQVWRVL
jgi:hypothetical protein